MGIDKGKIKKWVKQDLLVQQGDVERAIELAISKTISEFARIVVNLKKGIKEDEWWHIDQNCKKPHEGALLVLNTLEGIWIRER